MRQGKVYYNGTKKRMTGSCSINGNAAYSPPVTWIKPPPSVVKFTPAKLCNNFRTIETRDNERFCLSLNIKPE